MPIDNNALRDEVLAFHNSLIERLVHKKGLTKPDATRFVFAALLSTADDLKAKIAFDNIGINARRQSDRYLAKLGKAPPPSR